jgi:very-short-patch-repair endonuclease
MSSARGPQHMDMESAILTLAARQHGVVARLQLLRAEVSRDVIDHRLRIGWLKRLHRGVYRVGPLTAANAREMAAVLACGESAVVSRRSATGLWKVEPRENGAEPVSITVGHGRAGRRPNIRVRHMPSLMPDETTVLDGIPITTPARTLYDLADFASERELERALAEAFALRLVDRAQLVRVLDRHARQPGASRLRRLLVRDTGLALTRSEAEERFLALVRKCRLMEPDVNAKIAGYTVDFLWRAERLVVEVDGRAFHAMERRFESDRRRDAALIAAGLRVMRVTWQQIVKDPEIMMVCVAQALARPA